MSCKIRAGGRTPVLAWAVSASLLLHFMVVYLGSSIAAASSLGGAQNAAIQVRLALNTVPDTPIPHRSESYQDKPQLPVSVAAKTDALAGAIGGTGSSKYYELYELDAAPSPMGEILPQYPEDAASSSLKGRVRMEMLLNESGEVDSLQVLETELPEAFSRAALADFKHARFQPGRVNGIAVKSRLRMTLVYGEQD